MEKFFNSIINILNINADYALVLSFLKILLIALVTSIVSYLITKKILMKIIIDFVRKTKTKWDDYFINRGLFSNISLLVPIAVMEMTLRYHSFYNETIDKVIKFLFIISIIRIIQSVLHGFEDIYNTYEIAKEKPIKSYIQIINIFVILTGLIIFIALLINKSPLALLSGIGALTAVILLVFKDALLGFVASIQLAANNLVSLGDWIEMPSQGADGQVIEINLTNVKVQNWDKTIVTIPSYSLVSQSFKNWKGMEKSGGRRIKKTINIDIGTIRFLSSAELEKFSESKYLKEYLEYKKEAMGNYNKNELSTLDMRRINNVALFRIYFENYLRMHKYIDEEKPVVVRQLQSNQFGLPLEIYCFARVISWAEYEKIQSDIIDYAISIIPSFELAVFQSTSGYDLRRPK